MIGPSTLGITVLVVEDEPQMRDFVASRLRRTGYRVETALKRSEILDAVDAGRCGAIVLDLGLPGDDGVMIARAVRRRSNIPILMLTGRSGVSARVEGLVAGADDYLVKPFAPEELEARLFAILRRTANAQASTETAPIAQSVILSDSRLDCASGDITGPRGHARLTAREVNLVLALCRSQGTLSREAAYREILERPWDPLDRTLDVHVANLRRKLSETCTEDVIIRTVRGSGYELCVTFKIDFA